MFSGSPVFSGNLEGAAQRCFCLLEVSRGLLCDAERAEGRRGQLPVVKTLADGNGGLRGPHRLDSSAVGRQGLGPEAERVRLVLQIAQRAGELDCGVGQCFF
jgi:hypothetical protein